MHLKIKTEQQNLFRFLIGQMTNQNRNLEKQNSALEKEIKTLRQKCKKLESLSSRSPLECKTKYCTGECLEAVPS